MNASVTSTAKSGHFRSFSFLFASAYLPEPMCNAFRERGLTVIPLPPFAALPAPVAAHADMLLYLLDGSLLMHAQYHRENECLFDGIPIVTTDEPIGNLYPQDVLLNALPTAAGVFCREHSVSRRIKDAAGKIINVAQGYTRCAVCKADEHSLITADPSIAIAARDHGLSVLEITSGNILLPGYSYGFIGGCCVRVGNEMLFTGDITAHPDFASIDAFLGTRNIQAVSLSADQLTDYGGFVLI